MIKSTEDTSEIDDIVAELRDSAAPSQKLTFKSTETVDVPKIDDNNVNDYIYEKSAQIIENAIAAMNNMTMLIQTAADPKEISAYAQLMNTAIKGIENLNKINIQQKTAKNNIDVKKIEVEGRKGQPLLGGTGGPQTNNIFIGTREEALKLQQPKNQCIDLIDNIIVDE